MQIGIVVLPFSAKSTMFQAITKTHLDPSALARTEAHHAVVKVPDRRLTTLSELFSPKKTVNATIEIVDVVGLKKGESGSAQFTTNFLASVKTNDALVQVVRAFANDAVPHPDGSVDAARDIATFETEFILSDMAVLETRIERLKKQIQKAGDETSKKELHILERCLAALTEERPLREIDFPKEEALVLRTYQLLTSRPMLIALNFDESQQPSAGNAVEALALKVGNRNTGVVGFFGKIDMEMSELTDAEAGVFMKEYGITESALDTLIRSSYDLLGLQSFFTVGDDECRAWTIRKGVTAQEAAGVIHSDFYSKFIRAEVVSYDHFMAAAGSFAKAKEAGHWRLEGKEYVVKDGDILSIRHS